MGSAPQLCAGATMAGRTESHQHSSPHSAGQERLRDGLQHGRPRGEKPWPHAHSWVGTHSSYFWCSPWEVPQVQPMGGRNTLTCSPTSPKAHLWDVLHTPKPRGRLGWEQEGRDVSHLSPSPSLLLTLSTVPILVPILVPIPVCIPVSIPILITIPIPIPSPSPSHPHPNPSPSPYHPHSRLHPIPTPNTSPSPSHPHPTGTGTRSPSTVTSSVQ